MRKCENDLKEFPFEHLSFAVLRSISWLLGIRKLFWRELIGVYLSELTRFDQNWRVVYAFQSPTVNCNFLDSIKDMFYMDVNYCKDRFIWRGHPSTMWTEQREGGFTFCSFGVTWWVFWIQNFDIAEGGDLKNPHGFVC